MLPKIQICVPTQARQPRASILNFEVNTPKMKLMQSSSPSFSIQDANIMDGRRHSNRGYNEQCSYLLDQQENIKQSNKYQAIIEKSMKIQQNYRKTQTLKNCVQKFRQATQVKSITSLTKQQIYSINDQASDFQEPDQQFSHEGDVQGKEFQKLYRHRSQGQQMQGDFYKLVMTLITENKLKHKFYQNNLISKMLEIPIRPSHPFLIFWNILKIGLILHTFFSYPLQDAFGDKFSLMECQNFSLLITMEFFFLILDIFLRFNMSVYDRGELIVNRQKIAIMYLKKGLLLDLIALFGFMIDRSFYVIGNDHCLRSTVLDLGPLLFLKYTFLLRLFQLRKFLKFMRHELDPQNKYNSQVKLTSLFFLVVMMAHIIVRYSGLIDLFQASAWIAVGFYSLKSYSDSWISAFNLQDAPWHQTYIIAIYYACMTMTTVGYGDVLPKNELEYIVCIAIMLISCAIFAYTLNTITTVLFEINKSQSLHKKDLDIMQSYLIKKGIDHTLQRRVKSYLKTLWKSGQMEPMHQELAVFNKLSSTIQYDIQLQDKGKQLLKIPFLVNNFTQDFIQRLIKVVQEMNFSPQETIITQNSNQGNIGMFIVYSGEVDMMFEKQQHTDKKKLDVTHLATLKVGDYYGIKQLFDIPQEEFTLRSKDFTILYFVTIQDFMSVLLDEYTDQTDRETFCMIRDQILFQNQQDKLYQPCYSCKKEGHDLISCQDLFYQPNISLALAKFNATNDLQKSTKIDRKPRSKHALTSKILNHEQAHKIRREKLDLSVTDFDSDLEEDDDINGHIISNQQVMLLVDDSQNDDPEQSQESWRMDDANEQDSQHPPNRKIIDPQKKSVQSHNHHQHVENHKKKTIHKKATFQFPEGTEHQISLHDSRIMKNSIEHRIKRQTKHISQRVTQSGDVIYESTQTGILSSKSDQLQRENDIRNFEMGKNYKIYFFKYNMELVIIEVNKYLEIKCAKQQALITIPKQKGSKWLKLKQKKGFK